MEVTRFTFEPDLQERFIELPWQVYRNDSHWIPPFRSSVHGQLARANPFFAYGQMQHFLASDHGKDRARVSAIINDRLQEEGRPLGLLGFFESVEDYEATRAVLDSAVAWLRAMGVRTIRGPINTSTWHSYRFVTAGFEHPPFLMEPYNKPWYPAYWEDYGFRPVAHYVSNFLTDLRPMIEKTREAYQACMAAGYRIEPIDMNRFDEALEVFYRLTVAIFAGNWGYSEIEWEEFRQMYQGMKSLIEPRLILFACDKAGEPAGFLFGLPDCAEPVRRMGGEQHLWAKIKFLWALRGVRRAIFKTLGVLPAHRKAQVASAMTHAVHANAVALGYRDAIHPLMFQDNYSRRISEKASETFREYAVFELRA